jgi:hypothetical protein
MAFGVAFEWLTSKPVYNDRNGPTGKGDDAASGKAGFQFPVFVSLLEPCVVPGTPAN